MINKNRNKLSEYIYSFYDKGIMKDYSDKHFLIRAMKGEIDIIQEYGHILSDSFKRCQRPDFSSSFLINFSNKLHRCSNVFSEESMCDFVRNQLAAGKEHYREESFFEALSEINVLFYFCNFVGRIKKCEYEPKQGENGAIKPNIVLDQSTKASIIQVCEENKLQLIYPRVSKLGEFIKSAADKFQEPSSNKHFNLLFINWTYTDFPECGVNEPMSLLINTKSGLFYNDRALPLIRHKNGTNIINRSDLDKITAVILYRDTMETLLSGDFRLHFKERTFRYSINRINNTATDFDLLSRLLGMNPCNDDILCEWYPFDYMLHTENTRDLFQKLTATLVT